MSKNFSNKYIHLGEICSCVSTYLRFNENVVPAGSPTSGIGKYFLD